MAATKHDTLKAESTKVNAAEMLAMVAHDLRSPLSTIVMSADLLYDGLTDDVQRSHVMSIVHHSAQQMERLIEDLMDISKVEAGALRIELTSVSPRDLVIESCASFQSQADAKRIRLTWQAAPSVTEIFADRDRLEEVLSNLLSNALKFTPDGGHVELNVEQGDGEVLFTVNDTGCGIGEDQLTHVFDRFWQARHVKRAGAGLGLAISRGIVEAHGGMIWVNSRLGEGSTFVFSVPVDRRLASAA